MRSPAATPTTAAEQMPDWLTRQSRVNRDGIALRDDSVRLTWGELDMAVGRCAAALRARGIGPGNRVGLLAGNSCHLAVAIHALRRVGAVLVPLNVRLTPPEVAGLARAGETAAIIADDDHAALASGAASSVWSLAELTGDTGLSTQPAPAIDLAAVQSVVFTSGTTGTPKGAQLTYGNWYWGAVGSTIHLGHLPTDRWLAVLPLFHVGGLAILFRSAITGVPVEIHRRFDPDRVRHALANGTTLASLVPTMLDHVLEPTGTRPIANSARAILIGGAGAPRDLIERALAAGLPVAPTYGLTETASQAATLRPDRLPGRVGSSGQPLPVTDVRIDGDPGEPGEILVRGRTVMRGYVGPESGLDADGWFRTGDIGALDHEGYLTVLDRRTDLIVSGGENIYPAEVESVLLAHPGVVDVAVVAGDDPRWGAVPVAFVVPQAGAPADPGALAVHARRSLAGYKVPKAFQFVDALPRTASGKIRRAELRAAVHAKSDPF